LWREVRSLWAQGSLGREAGGGFGSVAVWAKELKKKKRIKKEKNWVIGKRKKEGIRVLISTKTSTPLRENSGSADKKKKNKPAPARLKKNQKNQKG